MRMQLVVVSVYMYVTMTMRLTARNKNRSIPTSKMRREKKKNILSPIHNDNALYLNHRRN